ncbi:hypothetical protein [Mycoplasma feriruminatoris]|uniref:hypothetical protein n=1 Tax=Mycoplasma feriruminatoris TaxID=1179777 RepID=UPI00241E1976|nr:hypothetical protein [Mycoplasma feriruminatoris]WFQ94402.1 hypothetical protein MFERI15220_00480 [Mycoplasma feriruminatoris]
MKKFLTILSFLTTISSSLVVACKTDNVDKEVKNKENKNEQNNNQRDNNLKEKDTKNKEEKREHKENKKDQSKSEKGAESEPNSNNILSPNNNSADQSNSNSGSLNDNENLPKNLMPNDESSNEERQEEANRLKAEIDEALDKMDDMKIDFFFKDLYFNIVQNDFDNKLSKLMSDVRNVIPELFKKYETEGLKTQISIFIGNIFGEKYKWNEKNREKLNTLLTNIVIKEEEKTIDAIEQLFIDLLTDELQNKQNESVSEIEKLIKGKQYPIIKQKLHELINKSKSIEKIPLISNF